MSQWVRPLDEFGKGDVAVVGGKNASLGEMLQSLKDKGVRVPDGVAVTVDGYRRYLEANDLGSVIDEALDELAADPARLSEVGARIRRAVGRGEFPSELADEIRNGYERLCEIYGTSDVDVAVRSSATAEDLPDASFAGQQDTLLNVTGPREVLDAVKYCYTSLFTDRAIGYRTRHGFRHSDVGLSVGIQKMVRAGRACSGVAFTLDPDSGFPDVVVVNGSWGLGEHLVRGNVEPDEWIIFKPLLGGTGPDGGAFSPIIERVRGSKLSKEVYARGEAVSTKVVETRRRERERMVLEDDEVLELAGWAKAIEEHYGRPMDIEWAKDADSDEIFVVQARPETVQSRAAVSSLKTYTLSTDERPLVSGVAVGASVASGKVRVLDSPDEIDGFEDGDVLVTEMTDPDWGPVLQKAAAVVTDRGGRTAHAAIISRELGIPAVVGTGDASTTLEDGSDVTVSCAEGEVGRVYPGRLEWTETELDITNLPASDTAVMLILASPGAAQRWWKLPADGVGLARMEFIVNDHIQIHPLALVRFDDLEDQRVRRRIESLTVGYDDLGEFFVSRLASGIARIAASRYPDPVVVRTSDFKSNEYAELIGGSQFEPDEENPMLGWRGASRYYSPEYREAFALECEALRRVRDEIGLTNVVVMLPFVRTPEEADRVLDVMAEHGLRRGMNGLKVYVMAEIPANVLLAKEFAQRFDGFSIGSNDLTQLVLGVDRDSDRLAHLFDERNAAVQEAIRMLISTAHAEGVVVGICGQGPSDHPEFTEFLVGQGIDSISVNPDALFRTRGLVADAEAGRRSATG